jgi:hypothetical protein
MNLMTVNFSNRKITLMDSNSNIRMRNVCKILVGIFEGNETLRRPRSKWGSKSK